MRNRAWNGRGVLVASALCALALALAPTVSPARIGAQESSARAAGVPGTLNGTWTLEGGVDRAMRHIEAAFRPSLQSIPEMLHGMALDRLRRDLRPASRILINADGTQLRMRLDAAEAIQIRGALGATASVSGTQARVTPRLSGGWLELRHEGEGSAMRQLFSTEPDGARMHLDYTITSPMIRPDVRFRLEYVRAPG